MSRKEFVGDRLSSFFCSFPGSLKTLFVNYSWSELQLSCCPQTHRSLGVHRVGVSCKSCSVRLWIHGTVEFRGKVVIFYYLFSFEWILGSDTPFLLGYEHKIVFHSLMKPVSIKSQNLLFHD